MCDHVSFSSEENGYCIPLIGEKFPCVDVQTTHGSTTLPDAFQGKWFVLFSHPADFTPVCTTEFVAFQERYKEFENLDCGLIGLSIDQVFSHLKWIEWIKNNLNHEIQFPIIADDAGRVSERLGFIHPGKGTNTVRAVFIVDPSGMVRAILYYPQELGRNVAEILRMVRGLQISDENKVVLPANWPKNELVGSDVILPPASDEKTARRREKEYTCYDWWFCHKALD